MPLFFLIYLASSINYFGICVLYDCWVILHIPASLHHQRHNIFPSHSEFQYCFPNHAIISWYDSQSIGFYRVQIHIFSLPLFRLAISDTNRTLGFDTILNAVDRCCMFFPLVGQVRFFDMNKYRTRSMLKFVLPDLHFFLNSQFLRLFFILSELCSIFLFCNLKPPIHKCYDKWSP